MVCALGACATAARATELVDLADARPGRTGVCVTEMDRGERVEVPLTVLGGIGTGAPEGEIILVRLDDPRFEETGIIAGMSGSPVYLDGKLLGALAYGWPFAKEPIGGVTPFERMLEVAPGVVHSAGVARRPNLQEMLAAEQKGTLGETMLDWLLPEHTSSPASLPTIVSLGGLSLPLVGWVVVRRVAENGLGGDPGWFRRVRRKHWADRARRHGCRGAG